MQNDFLETAPNMEKLASTFPISKEERKYQSVLNKYDSLRITTGTNIVSPEPFISINNEIIATKGNILTISGNPKGGKSAFSNLLLAGAISPDGKYDGFEDVVVLPNPKGKAVIQFDTEQARHKHQRNIQSVLNRLNIDGCPDFFRSYNIRQLDTKDYKQTVLDICEAAHEKFNGTHLIILDGIADFISDVNDGVASTEVVKFAEGLSVKFDTVVLVIIHTNPSKLGKERGHLGSELQRKSESVLTVKQDKEVSFLEAKFLREGDKSNLPPLYFMYDKTKGYHVSCNARLITNSIQKNDVIVELANQVFLDGNRLKYEEAIQKLIEKSGKGKRLCKDLFKEMKAKELIYKDSDGCWLIRSENASQSEHDSEQIIIKMLDNNQVQSASHI